MIINHPSKLPISMVLHGKIGTEIEIKAPADKLYNIFKSAHLIPNISTAHIKGVDVHEGDWETHGSIKIWKYELGNVESCPAFVRDKVCYVHIWSWATPHIANWFYGGTPISSWYQSGLSSLENPPHVREHVESCPILVRDKVCYVHIWSWATPHIANWFYGDHVGIFKEQVELDDENKAATLIGLEGEMFKYYKRFKAVYQFTQKDEGTGIANLWIEYEKLNEHVEAPDRYIGLMVETEIEIKAPAEKFYNIFKRQAHHVPNISSGSIQGVQVHEGDWETHGSIKSWNYSVGDEVGVFKEKVEFNDEKKSITLNGLEGDVFQYYKSFKPVYQFTQKDEGNIANLSIEYEKLTEDVAAPDKYVGGKAETLKEKVEMDEANK
ncbi:hypothetical protein DVH24_040335 [Malus domestica]|uniref:Bet v I/Major latex protein domain-containing protein n=1 Tax=Malus domestica TaxID=3750 RepID=A0A498I618_MALDO|nr:hypothetical protein DVH24_040335 [Malus domestica]